MNHQRMIEQWYAIMSENGRSVTIQIFDPPGYVIFEPDGREWAQTFEDKKYKNVEEARNQAFAEVRNVGVVRIDRS